MNDFRGNMAKIFSFLSSEKKKSYFCSLKINLIINN